MGLIGGIIKSTGKLIQSSRNTYTDITSVKAANKEIYEQMDRLRNSYQYADIFYRLAGDVNHPPCEIEWTKNGTFYTQGWEARTNNYEPYSTAKYQDVNTTILIANALLALIQESYPNVYDFPGMTFREIEAGTDTYKLIMNRSFLGQHLIPAFLPERNSTQPEQTNTVNNQFCSKCGNCLAPEAIFCTECGNRIR